MGRVWLATVGVGVGAERVALKLMLAKDLGDPDLRRQFRIEARFASQTNHPCIVRVLALGTTQRAHPSAGISRGTPYMAMELGDGAVREVDSFTELRAVVISTLHGLANIHARGVTHRDIKPSNLLVFSGQEGLGRYKICDFGIALGARSMRPLSGGGSPSYMAPESFPEGTRLTGPWTDLYGLGCAVWKLATGHPPLKRPPGFGAFSEFDPTRIPPFRPNFPCPPSFVRWLARLIAPEPTRRWRSAAHALHALHQVAPEERVLIGAVPTFSFIPGPQSPRRDGAPRWPIGPAPFVGRDGDLRALRADFLLSRAQGSPRFMLLRGAAGVGRTRLMEALAEMSTLSAPTVTLRATHATSPGRGDGLRAMLARALRCEGLRPDEGRHHVQKSLGPDAPADVVHAVSAGLYARGVGSGGSATHTLLHAIERYTRWLSRNNRVMVMLSHASDGPRTANLIDHLRAHGAPQIYVILTADEREGEDAIVAQLKRGSGDWSSLALSPLRLEESIHLTSSLLPPGTNEERIRRVATASKGSPLYITHRTRLMLDQHELDAAHHPAVPEAANLHQLWLRIIAALLDGHQEWRRPLELGALLGARLDLTEWTRICRLAGEVHPKALLDRLLDRGLAAEAGRGCCMLAHPTLRTTIALQAAGRGALKNHLRVVQDYLLDIAEGSATVEDRMTWLRRGFPTSQGSASTAR